MKNQEEESPAVPAISARKALQSHQWEVRADYSLNLDKFEISTRFKGRALCK